ncbi:MAG: AraC family transcriptional regulator ligand-binding domain-containing protein [Pseudomonadales bacterium]|nr:AraC family transcriptional regulator ligand-binding domain-containing protein [Pseudomonadales bacterium]
MPFTQLSETDNKQLPLGIPALMEELSAQGITAEELFREARLPLPPSGALNIQHDELPAILNSAARIAREPDTALRAGLRQKVNHFGVFGYALTTSSSFGEAFIFGQNHIDLAGAIMDVAFSRQNDTGILRTQNHQLLGQNRRFIIEFWRSSMTTLLSEVLGHTFPSLRMYFPFPEPAWVDKYHEVFNCELYFDADTMEWQFDARVLSENCPRSDPMTSQVCQDLCDQLALENGESRLIRQIRGVCSSSSGSHVATAASVANYLGMSLRTLQRQLATQKTSFKQLQDESRYSIASQYLQNTNISIEDLAIRCGYSDVSNFRKAFVRWSGLSASEFRVRARQE